MARRRALLVGISQYPSHPLDGPVHDVELMNIILTEMYYYDTTLMIIDEDATKDNILGGLHWLVEGTQSGDNLVLYYSGHGTHLPVNDRTESGGFDTWVESLVSIEEDFSSLIHDRDLREILIPPLRSGARLCVLLDACFSGGMMRDARPDLGKAKYFPPPRRELLKDIGVTDIDFKVRPTRDNPDERYRLQPFLQDTVDMGQALMISACRDNQVSVDARFGNTYHGVMTFYLAQTLSENNWNMSYVDLITEINNKLDREEFVQDAVCEGHACYFDTLFLGGTK